MGFFISLKDKSRIDEVCSEIVRVKETSRFNFGIERIKGRIKLGGKGVAGVRLKESKDYCGAHAGPCKFTGIQEKHRKLKFLEGADWVAFNDMVNDILDRMGIEANVASSVCVIRKGLLRRTNYGSFGHGDFKKDEDAYAIVTSGKFKSSYPVGTPGNPNYVN